MTCQGKATGYPESSWGTTTVCVNLDDPATMLEVKSALYALTNVRTEVHSPPWTPADEGALRMWATQEYIRERDVMREGPLGWMVPSGEGIEAMAIWLGYESDDGGLRQRFPLLFGAMDENESHWISSLATTDPQIGAAGQQPGEQPPGDEPMEPPDGDEPPPPSARRDDPQYPPRPQAAAAAPMNYAVLGLTMALVGLGLATAVYVYRE